MSQATNFLEDKLIDLLFRTLASYKPGALYIALHTADPGETGANAEVTGGSYARVQRDPLDANWDAPSNGLTQNTAVITFPTATASWGTITHFSIWDAASGGNCLVYGTVTPSQSVPSGATASFAAGALDVSVA